MLNRHVKYYLNLICFFLFFYSNATNCDRMVLTHSTECLCAPGSSSSSSSSLLMLITLPAGLGVSAVTACLCFSGTLRASDSTSTSTLQHAGSSSSSSSSCDSARDSASTTQSSVSEHGASACSARLRVSVFFREWPAEVCVLLLCEKLDLQQTENQNQGTLLGVSVAVCESRVGLTCLRRACFSCWPPAVATPRERCRCWSVGAPKWLSCDWLTVVGGGAGGSCSGSREAGLSWNEQDKTCWWYFKMHNMAKFSFLPLTPSLPASVGPPQNRTPPGSPAATPGPRSAAPDWTRLAANRQVKRFLQ